MAPMKAWLTVAFLACWTSALAAPAKAAYFVYVGTYTGPASKGIYGFRFDPASGKFTPLGVAAEIANPSFVVTDPTHHYLYAVTEMSAEPGADSYKKDGTITSFAINPHTGALTFLNKVDAGGGGSCHLVVDKTGRMLFVANYGSGSVASFAIKPDGSIGDRTGFDQHTGSSVDPARQKGPHAHAVVLSPDNRFLFVPDLGTDQIKIYKVDAARQTFTPSDPPFATVKAGLGPRHFTFGPSAKFAYAVCEMGSSVAVFAYNPAQGALTPVQTISTLPEDFKGEDGSAEIEIDRNGRFLYASNRGMDSITVFAIDPVKGTLHRAQTISSQGKMPRNFALDPTGKYLVAANQKSGQMVVFSVDPHNGELSPQGQTLNVGAPVSILFVPAA